MAEWKLTDSEIYDVLDSDDDALEGHTYEGEGGFITTCDVHGLLIAQAKALLVDIEEHLRQRAGHLSGYLDADAQWWLLLDKDYFEQLKQELDD